VNWGEVLSTGNRDRSEASRQAFARFELLRSGVQFAASLCFLGGSTASLFRNPDNLSSWFFIAGSLLFCAVPTVKIWSEIALWRMGRTDMLAERSIGLAPGQFDDWRRERDDKE